MTRAAVEDPHDLQRFVAAQTEVYGAVLAELRAGRKTTHWMWFVFPQIRGLGSSWMSEHYAIASVDEARAYLAHPLLGARLRECTAIVVANRHNSAWRIFGCVDAMKFHSSLTLFAHATADNQVFLDALAKFFHGKFDSLTIQRLNSR